jgi:hypothetical protein
MAERSELFFATRIVEPVPVIAAAEKKMAMRKHDQMICIFAPVEIEDQETIGGQQKSSSPARMSKTCNALDVVPAG